MQPQVYRLLFWDEQTDATFKTDPPQNKSRLKSWNPTQTWSDSGRFFTEFG